MLPMVPESWWPSRRERLAKEDFLPTLKGSVQLGEAKLWKADGVRIIRWTGDSNVSAYPEAVDDARITLQIASHWPEQLADAEEFAREQDLISLQS